MLPLMASMARRADTLRRLTLRDTDLDDASASVLAEGLARLTRLEALDIGQASGLSAGVAVRLRAAAESVGAAVSDGSGEMVFGALEHAGRVLVVVDRGCDDARCGDNGAWRAMC